MKNEPIKSMTVKELIEKLQQFDGDLYVCYGMLFDIESVAIDKEYDDTVLII